MSETAQGNGRGLEPAVTREGAMAVVLSDDRRKVLLHRREIFWLWDLPGGGVERYENAAHAAVRETREETGYQIELEKKVGRYLCQDLYGTGDQLTHVFRAHLVGGRAKAFGLETTGLAWFPLEKLPGGLQALQRQMIADALAMEADEFERRIPFVGWKLAIARRAFFAMRWRNILLGRFLRRMRGKKR